MPAYSPDPLANQPVIDALRGYGRGVYETGKAAAQGLGQVAQHPLQSAVGAVQGAKDTALHVATTPLDQQASDLVGALRGEYARATESPAMAGQVIGENLNPLRMMRGGTSLLGASKINPPSRTPLGKAIDKRQQRQRELKATQDWAAGKGAPQGWQQQRAIANKQKKLDVAEREARRAVEREHWRKK